MLQRFTVAILFPLSFGVMAFFAGLSFELGFIVLMLGVAVGFMYIMVDHVLEHQCINFDKLSSAGNVAPAKLPVQGESKGVESS